MKNILVGKTLKGSISSVDELCGCLSTPNNLSGKLANSSPRLDVYEDSYEVYPSAVKDIILPTTDKMLKEDITIKKIPCWETSNESDGVTVYIAKEA